MSESTYPALNPGERRSVQDELASQVLAQISKQDCSPEND
jgi:hypothetical protein